MVEGMSEQLRTRINDLKDAGYTDAQIGTILGKSGSSVGRFRRGQTKTMKVEPKSRAKLNRLFTGKTAKTKAVRTRINQTRGVDRTWGSKIDAIIEVKEDERDALLSLDPTDSTGEAANLQTQIDALKALKEEKVGKLQGRVKRAKTTQDWERFKQGYQVANNKVQEIGAMGATTRVSDV